MLVVAAVVVALTRWRWAPALGAILALAEVVALVMTGLLADLIDVSPAGVFVSTWIRAVGVVTALIAGVAASAAGYRASSPAPLPS